MRGRRFDLRHFSPEDGDSMLLRNVGIYRRVYTAPKPRRTSCLLLREPPETIIKNLQPIYLPNYTIKKKELLRRKGENTRT
jgi:hypothetical protein